MTDDAEEEPSHARPGCTPGCLLRLFVVVAVIVAIMIAIGFAFDQDGDGTSGGSGGFNAGPAEEYERADVNHFENEHVFLTRLDDGTFIALYDKSPKQQEIRSDCRTTYDETTGIGALEPLPGIAGGLAENCGGTRAVWRADGERAFGAGYGNLDRFQTSIDDNGDLIIDTSSRTCTRSKAGVPPFVEQTCRGRVN